MSRDTTVIAFRQPDAVDDPLTELAREGARRMLAQVLIAEADAFVALWKNVKLPDGRDRVVRHGHGPHRAIQTGVGPVEVRRAQVRRPGATWSWRRKSVFLGDPQKWARSGRRASTRWYRFSTCAEYQPATSRRRLPPCWARRRQVSPAVVG